MGIDKAPNSEIEQDINQVPAETAAHLGMVASVAEAIEHESDGGGHDPDYYTNDDNYCDSFTA